MASDRLTCLIIGGNGFVGSGIRTATEESGWKTFIADRDSYDSYKGREFDLVINANGNSKRFFAEKDPLYDFEASAVSVYKSLLDFPSSRYALVSTVDVYNDTTRPESTQEDVLIDPHTLGPYAFHKWLAEQFVMRHQSSWYIFRLAQMVGDGLRKGPLFDLLNGQPLWIDGRTRLHFMHTRKVGAAICQLVQKAPQNQSYNVCGRGSVDFQRVLDMFAGNSLKIPESPGVQCYDVSTSRAEQWVELPDSLAEVTDFVKTSTQIEQH